MNFDKKRFCLYAITKNGVKEDNDMFSDVEKAIKGGVNIVQLREKNLDFEVFLRRAKELKKICSKYNVPLIINDNIEIATKSGADGVHIGQDDMDVKKARNLLGKEKILGVSAHTVEEAKEAESNGADYLGVGSVFRTSTKSDAKYIGIDKFKEVCASVSIPVVAIGGINKKNISELRNSNASGVALVSAIFEKEDIEQESIELKKIVEKTLYN